MIILYGGGEGRTVLDEVGSYKCPYCEEMADFTVVLDYRYSHIWYLFRLLRGRSYSLRCGHCGGLQKIDRKIAKKKYPKDGIPFIDKYGWAVCLGLLAMLILSFAAVQAYHFWSQDRWFASPKAGDIYLANLMRISESGFDSTNVKGGTAYGTLKLIEMRGDTLILAASRRAYPEAGQLRGILDSGEFSRYMDGPRVSLANDQLQRFHRVGIIFEVRR